MNICNAERMMKSEWCSAAESMNVHCSQSMVAGKAEAPHTHTLAQAWRSRNTFERLSTSISRTPSDSRTANHIQNGKNQPARTQQPARNVLTGYLGSCYSQPEKGPWLYLHCTSSILRRECANIRENFNRILTQSAPRPTPVRISIRTPASIPNAPTDLDAL